VQIPKSVRATARILIGQRNIRALHRIFRKTIPALDEYRRQLAGKRGLEIGGPSGIMSDDESLPIYQVLESLDNCLYSSQTLWTGSVKKGGKCVYHAQKPPGNQLICEATDLEPIRTAAYQCVLASHCLEHVANPLRALGEWRRVLEPEGLLLLILPHKDGTFDWRRPTTSLDHMISDRDNSVGEDDLTHLSEILELHDLGLDKAAGSKQQFRERCMDNYSKRAMHHHVFETGAVIKLLDYCNFQIIRVDTLKPYHIIVLARKCDGRPKNENFLGRTADYRRTSPFKSDRTLPGVVASPVIGERL
jgi:SAM-dependent methyltransferase